MTQRILNTTLCGLLTYFVLGLFLLGKGSFSAASNPLQWQFRIFAMVGFLVVALGLLILCLLGKSETDKSLRRLRDNPWFWGLLGFFAIANYGAMVVATLSIGDTNPPFDAPMQPFATWQSWLNAFAAFFFGCTLSIFSAFIIDKQKHSTYSQVLFAVTAFCFVLCLATFILTHLPNQAVIWINFSVLIVFWTVSVVSAKQAKPPQSLNDTEQNYSSKESYVAFENNRPDRSPITSENVFDVFKDEHELLAMLISSLFGVFLFGVTSNSDGNPGPFDWGSNSLFGMLVMSLVLLPIVFALRKHNLVPIFYWLVFPLIASILTVLDTFPEHSVLAFVGSTGVYFFCTVVFLFSLALLVMLVQNSDKSPFLPVILAEITLAVACLCGIGIANISPDQNIRGPIVLILATLYFVYVLFTPILLFWQSRKSSQSVTISESQTVTSRDSEMLTLSYDDKMEAITTSFGLSKREKEILELVGKGYNSPYIAATLVISENTTRTHLKNIYRKLGVSNRMDVVEMVNGWE